MRIRYIFVLSLAFLSCKKKIEEVKGEQALGIITNGFWKISDYTDAGTDLTAEFGSYQFQFNKNFTVQAIDNGTIVCTGTWSGDISKQTVTSNFETPPHPLELLNGTWDIMGGDYRTVLGRQIISGQTRSLKLEKL